MHQRRLQEDHARMENSKRAPPGLDLRACVRHSHRPTEGRDCRSRRHPLPRRTLLLRHQVLTQLPERTAQGPLPYPGVEPQPELAPRRHRLSELAQHLGRESKGDVGPISVDYPPSPCVHTRTGSQ